VEAKARAAFALVQAPVLVEDVALDIAALGGFPGPFVKFWLHHVGYGRAAEIAMKMGDQRVTARCGAGYCDGERFIFVEGVVSGTIVPKRGEGFGFDPSIVPDGHDQTFAEMGMEKKNMLSHRSRALTAMRQKLVEAGVLS
ncbi:MAG: non-canonical purine NTP pyrophosphatase, partial [Patescibacteria group bacterium]